jgi:osmoprotectant transport system permease protein
MMFDFWQRYQSEIITATLQHLVIVSVAIGIAVSVGVPLGILCTRRRGWERGILGFANLMQTIPSLALFGLLIPLPLIGGLGARPAIVALTLYSLLPIIRNTFIGITTVDPAVREAGRGMGMTANQLLRQVELPLAMGVILAGIRVATVIGVGLATIAAAIGAGGLGELIFRGVATVDNSLILAGAIPAAILALMADFGLAQLERRFSHHIRRER